jgi:LacI family transcriptional regulator
MTGSPERKKSAPTIIDIARLADLSKSTVAMALKHSPLIKPETSARVWKAAQELGYVYNRSAASLRQKTSNIVGLVIHDLSNPFFVEMLIGAERILLDAGYLTLMAHTSERLDIQTKVLNSMREHNAAGIIMCPAFQTPPSLLADLQAWSMPLVVVMRPLDDAHCDTVGCENVSGMAAATRHLISLGHRRIGFIGRKVGSNVSEARVEGYREAMREAALPVNEDWIQDVPITSSGGRQGIALLAMTNPQPTAVVCYNDAVALGVLNELDSLGKRAGRDLAVVGFDDIAAAAHTSPPLTTMSVGPAHLGEIASRILLGRINGQESSSPPKRYYATPKLVVRESSGPPHRGD